MTSIRSILPFLCFTSWFYLHAEITDWTRFRGPQGSGISTTADLPLKWSENNNLTWQVDLPGEGASSPIVWKDHIYLTAFTSSGNETEALKRHVLCLNRNDGREIWRRTVFADLPEQENIRENHGYATNSPAVDENRVYVFFGKSGVMALNHHGKELWRTRVGSRIHGWALLLHL